MPRFRSLFIFTLLAWTACSSSSFAATSQDTSSKKTPPSSTPLATTDPSAKLAPQDPSQLPLPSTKIPMPGTPSLPPVTVVDSFAPLTITLHPKKEATPLPPWALAPVKVKPELSCVEIPLPAVTEQSEIEAFSLTVNFNDHGDGGPLVEWIKPQGERIMLASGLGTNGPALGPNSRTLLISNEIALDGGTIVVTHASRFDQLLSLTVRPGRAATVAVLGSKNNPALIDESLKVVQKDLADGKQAAIKRGDSMRGCIISAELAAPVERLHENEIEFIVPLQGLPEATILHTEFIGLNLESQIDVQVNGIFLGNLNTPDFKLDTPELIKTASQDNSEPTKFQLAGWRDGSLYIPARVWKEGENSIIFSVRSPFETPTTLLSLRNTTLDLRYAIPPATAKHSATNSTPLATAKNLFRF